VSETAFSKQRSTIAVRPIAAVEEMKLGVELQKQIWGYSPLDTVPEQLFVVAQESGGHVLVAFDGDKPVKDAQGPGAEPRDVFVPQAQGGIGFISGRRCAE